MFLAAAPLVASCHELPRYESHDPRASRVRISEAFGTQDLPRWHVTAAPGTFAVKDGALRLEGVKNHPLWLSEELPSAFRVTFDAWAESDEGDIKVEVCGDGRSFARSANYVASGYVVIFGGWNNSLSAIVRQDEHGRDRVTRMDKKARAHKRTHHTLTYEAGELAWVLDGQSFLQLQDDAPLCAPGHRFFALSGWEAPVRFDNVVVQELLP